MPWWSTSGASRACSPGGTNCHPAPRTRWRCNDGCARRSPACGAPSRSGGTAPSRSTRSARCWRCSTRRSSRPCRRSTARWTGGSIPTGAALASPPFQPFLRWGTWVGGDRDGNPAVTAEVTKAAMAIQTDHALRGLEAVSRRIARTLSVSERNVPPSAGASPGARPRCAAAAGGLRTSSLASCPTHRTGARWDWPRTGSLRRGTRANGAYDGPDAFLRDLDVLQRSLEAGGASRLAWGELQHLRWQVETFGFHLASMEVRQHSSVLRAARDELASAGPGSPALAPRPARSSPRSARSRTSRHASGPDACERVIVSFTRSADDLAGVLELARASPCPRDRRTSCPSRCSRPVTSWRPPPRSCEAWVTMPAARRLLRRHHGELEVMVGYSDSAKEVGMLAANLELYGAQRSMAAWARDEGLRLTIFHGRGGALGRGGGPASRAIAAEPPGSVGGRFKVTEQGEVAFARYGNAALARRHLEQMTNAVVRASAGGPRSRDDPADRFATEIEEMSTASRPTTRRWSRPTASWSSSGASPRSRRSAPCRSRHVRSRAASSDATALEDLRAIPWVFAWSQSRVNLTGWYGLGAGLEAVAHRRGGLRPAASDGRGMAVLLHACSRTPSSRWRRPTSRSPSRTSLAAPDPTSSRAIRDELERTTAMVLMVTGHDRLLDAKPELQRAIEFRNPYVDALSFLQVRFLDERANARDRATDPGHDQRRGRGPAEHRLSRRRVDLSPGFRGTRTCAILGAHFERPFKPSRGGDPP